MARFLLKRIGLALLSIWAVYTLTFFAAYLAPGDPAQLVLGQHSDPAAMAQVRHDFGLDKPPLVRYANSLWNALHGDLGRSFYRQEPVTEFFARAFVPTATVAVAAILLALIAGAAIGICAALRPNSGLDRLLMSTVLVGVTLPSFVLGPALILLMALRWNWLPVAGWGNEPTSFDAPEYIILPALVLAARPMALVARMTRSSMLETLRQDYIRTARAKGLHPATILFKHTLKNAALPVLTTAGVSFGYLLSGSFVVEKIFGVPGIGFESINALSTRDYSVIQGSVLLLAVVFVTINLLVDLMYAVLDPRVKQDDGLGRAGAA